MCEWVSELLIEAIALTSCIDILWRIADDFYHALKFFKLLWRACG